MFKKKSSIVQSAWAVEYTDCTSAKEYDPSSTSVPDMTLNNLMVSLQPWRFRECKVPLHCHCSHVTCPT